MHPFSPRKSSTLLVFCLSLLISLCCVFSRGAWDSDLGGDPDEAAHAVTSLMIRDYMAGGFLTPPMQFAKNYYTSFPKVALGHYPPGYYLVAAPLLLACTSVKVLFTLQAFLLATLATIASRLLLKFTSAPLAVVTGLSVVLSPLSLQQTQIVMSDVLLAVFCIWAAVLWGRYLSAPSLSRALLWGCIASSAILTKGSGVGLCLLPPLGTLLAGRWRLIFTWSWWCAALPVVILAGPWMIYSTGISKEGMTLLSPAQYFLEATPFYLKAMPAVFGWPMIFLVLAGVCQGVVTISRHRALGPLQSSLIAMAAGMTLVLLLVPVGLSTRYMLTLVPPLMLAAARGFSLVPWKSSLARWFQPALLLVFALLPLQNTKLWPMKDVHGFGSAVSRSGLPQPGHEKESWLVASDPRGEGAVIAAAAFSCPQRSPSLLSVYRGSKELSTSDWMGRGYHQAFVSTEQLLEHLDKLQISRVFVDLSVPPDRQQPHENLLFTAMRSANDRWHLAFEQPVTRQPGETGMLQVYRRVSPATSDRQN